MRKLSTRETIAELLRTYQEVASTLNHATDWISDKPGSRILTRPSSHPYFTGSYRQLEEVLRFMRAGGNATNNRDRKKVQASYQAIRLTYLNSERRQVLRVVNRRVKGKGTVASSSWHVEPVVRVPVDKRDLELGVAWVAGGVHAAESCAVAAA